MEKRSVSNRQITVGVIFTVPTGIRLGSKTVFRIQPEWPIMNATTKIVKIMSLAMFCGHDQPSEFCLGVDLLILFKTCDVESAVGSLAVQHA